MAFWNDEVVAVRRNQGYVVQKLCGEAGDIGMITIPWKGLCTVTFIKQGSVHVVNEHGKILGKLGTGRFHYSLIDLETRKEVPFRNAAKVEPVDGYIPTKEELDAAGAQKQIKLVSLEPTVFYCISDPNGQLKLDGELFEFTEESPYYDISPEQLKRLIPIDDGIRLNNEEIKIHKVIYTDQYDSLRISGTIGSQFIIFKYVGNIQQ